MLTFLILKDAETKIGIDVLFEQSDVDKDGKLNKTELEKFLDLCDVPQEGRNEFVSFNFKKPD